MAAAGADDDLAEVRRRISIESNRESQEQTGSREACSEAVAMEEAATNRMEEDPSSLYIDLRRFLDRAPVTVRYSLYTHACVSLICLLAIFKAQVYIWTGQPLESEDAGSLVGKPV